jgi:hypothetical protein
LTEETEEESEFLEEIEEGQVTRSKRNSKLLSESLKITRQTRKSLGLD